MKSYQVTLKEYDFDIPHELPKIHFQTQCSFLSTAYEALAYAISKMAQLEDYEGIDMNMRIQNYNGNRLVASANVHEKFKYGIYIDEVES